MAITRTKKLIASATIGAGLLAGSLGVATMVPGVASAATPTTSSASVGTTAHPLLHRLRHRELKVAADTIGVAPATLGSDLKAGQSIADVATANGVSVDSVVNAVVSDASARIAQAVTNGRLTQAQADALTAKLPAFATRLVNAHYTAR
jgi:hypothetical protein